MRKLIAVIMMICMLVMPVATSEEEIELSDDVEMDAGEIELEIEGIPDEGTIEYDISLLLPDNLLAKSIEGEDWNAVTNNANAMGIAIDEATFPDAAFRTYISDCFDADGNEFLSEDEIDLAREVDVSSKGINSLAGIECLTQIISLDCSCNNLTSLDVSHNSYLTTLYCSGNEINRLDMGNNPVLTTLYCAGNALTDLNIHNNSELLKLDCSRNELKELGLSNNRKLEYLDISNNYDLGILDISQNKELVELWCESVGLERLDITNNENLMWLHCGYSRLKYLEFGYNTSLENISYLYNYIGKIDISKCYTLVNLIKGKKPQPDDHGHLCYYDENRNQLIGPISYYTTIVVDGETLYKGIAAPASVIIRSDAYPFGLEDLNIAVGMKLNIFSKEDPEFSLSECIFKSSNPRVIQVSQDGVITCLKVGKAKITVTASNGYREAVTFKVKAAPWKVTLDRRKGTLKIGETGQLKATIPKHTFTELKWSSNNKAVATVNSSGLVTAVGAGTATITVKTHNGKKATCKVTVIDPSVPAKVKLNKTGTVKLKKGKTLQLRATVLPSTAETTLSWKSSKEKVATVTQDGLVTAKKNGTTTITVMTGNGKTAKVKIKVV